MKLSSVVCQLFVYKYVLFVTLDKLEPKPKTKNQIFLLLTFRLFYTLCLERTFLTKCFLVPLFKVYKKVIEFSFTPTKNILVFSFSFLFQFIQRIEQYLHSSSWQAALDFVLFFFKINGTIFLKNLLIFTYLPLISLLYTDDSVTYT